MRITTPRLVLRPLTDADAPALLAYWSEPTVNCFADMKMESVNDAVRYIRDTVHADEHFGVCLHDGTLIGDMLADKDGPDTYGLVWSLNPRYQGKGYALEAAKAFLGYLFERAGARRVYAYVEDDNLPSRKLCERLGMRLEGCMREFISFVSDPDGTPRYENTCIYAILRKEWPLTLGVTNYD